MFLTILFIVTAELGCAAAFRYYMHMFQLNSYNFTEHTEWMKQNVKNGFILRAYPALVSLAASFFGNAGLIIGCAANILFIINYCTRKHKAKKPLVFTARVKRMTVTAVLLNVLLCLLVRRPFIFPVVMLLVNFIIMLANFLNKPIEKAVANHYIGEAKRKIDAMPDLIVIGITGSYGKTSTKYYLQKILSAKYNVLMTPESYNTTMGVVKTVREYLDLTHEIFICEMGAKNVGEIKEICDIVHPKYGIITSIGPQHLETFRSIENIIKTKFELCDALPEDGVIFLNGDNQYIAGHKPSRKAVYYGYDDKNLEQFFAENIKLNEIGTSFDVDTDKGMAHFETSLLGKHNIENVLGCIAVGSFFGLSKEQMQLPVKRLESAPHRLQLRPGGEFNIIDDAFNSNPTSSKAALDVLSNFGGVRIMITPGLVELGEESKKYNFEFGKYAADKCDYVYLVGERITKDIKEGLLYGGMAEDKIRTFETVNDAIAFARGTEPGNKKFVLLENDLPDNY